MRKVKKVKKYLRHIKRVSKRALARRRRQYGVLTRGRREQEKPPPVPAGEYEETVIDDDGSEFSWGIIGPGVQGGKLVHFSGDFGDVYEYQAGGSQLGEAASGSPFASLLPLEGENEAENGDGLPPKTRPA